MSEKGALIAAALSAFAALAFFLSGYVPIIGMLGFLLVPTAILVFVSSLAAYFAGGNARSQWLVGCGTFLVVALAGVGSRWVDKIRANKFYAPDTTITAPLQVTFGTPIQVILNGSNVTSAGEIRFSEVAAHTPAAICKSTPLGCARTTALQWMAEVTWEEPHRVLGRLGLRAGPTPAPLVLNVDIQEQPESLLMTTELKNSGTLVARSVRRLPKEKPPESPAVELWFWHVLEDNLLTLLIGPNAERIPHDNFKKFLSRSLTVLPQTPAPLVAAEIVERTIFDPPQSVPVNAIEDPSKDRCPVQMFGEGGSGHSMMLVWDERHDTVAAIPTFGQSVCLSDGIYTYRRTGDDTYTIEHYALDGALHWRRSIRFPSRFGHDTEIVRSTLSESGGRAVAVLNVFDYHYAQEGQFRVRQNDVLWHERIAFSFPTPDETGRAE
jgi:hypothetical protein